MSKQSKSKKFSEVALKQENKPYRPNVGMVVFNSQGLVLTGERLKFPDAWQFPQGGIDDSEEPITAANRELYEEVGIRDAILVYEFPGWISYDFPPDLKLKGKMQNYRGQIQKWFLYFWDHPVTKCSLDHHEKEFEELRFLPWEKVINSIVPFKKEIYQNLEKEFVPIIEEFLASLRKS